MPLSLGSAIPTIARYVGATSICGSSAATAITAAIQVTETTPYSIVSLDRVSVMSISELGGMSVAEKINGKTDQSCRSIIALMGILNTPLMPLVKIIFLYS